MSYEIYEIESSNQSEKNSFCFIEKAERLGQLHMNRGEREEQAEFRCHYEEE